MHVHLVDGTFELFRCFFGAPPRQHNGLEIGATRGIVSTQMPLVEQASRALGFVTWSMIDHECDDAMATMAATATKDPRVQRVHLCSPDKDLCQMVTGDRVVLVDRIRKKTIDEAGVIEKFGVPPRLIRHRWLRHEGCGRRAQLLWQP